MKITYKRELKHNYLIIEPEEVFCDSYELRMLASNCIDGLLKFHVKQVDSRKSYYYEITSRQPLSRLLECHNIGAQELKCLVSGIGQSISRLEVYLLREEQILLDPEFIYVDPERYETSLCLVPGKQGDFPEDMTKLLQYLLGKVDHQDKECVVLAYGLYQESLKENYGLDSLLKLLVKRTEENSSHIGRTDSKTGSAGNAENWPEDESRLEIREREDIRGREDILDRDEETVWMRYNAGDMAYGIDGGGERNSVRRIACEAALLIGVIAGGPLLVWLLEGLNGITGYRYILLAADAVAVFFFLYRRLQMKTDRKDIRKQPEWGLSGPSEYSFPPIPRPCPTVRSGQPKEKGIGRERAGKVPPETAGKGRWQMTFTEEEEAEEQEEKRAAGEDEDEVGTVLLTEAAKKTGMRYLRAMGEGSEDIIISYVPFIIGKQEGLVDFVLNRETVSRLHARIDREGEEYRITDLNSTNGTMVGGKTLETNETVALRPGDEVYIANLGFIFT